MFFFEFMEKTMGKLMETLWRCKSGHWTYWIFPGRLSEAEEWFRIWQLWKDVGKYNISKQTWFFSRTYIMKVLSSIHSQEKHMNKVRTENTHVLSSSISNATLELNKNPWKLWFHTVRKSACFFPEKCFQDLTFLARLEATYGGFQFGGARFKVRPVDRRWSQIIWMLEMVFHSDFFQE